MGLMAAKTLLRKIAGKERDLPSVIQVEPQLVVRGTTARCKENESEQGARKR